MTEKEGIKTLKTISFYLRLELENIVESLSASSYKFEGIYDRLEKLQRKIDIIDYTIELLTK